MCRNHGEISRMARPPKSPSRSSASGAKGRKIKSAAKRVTTPDVPEEALGVAKGSGGPPKARALPQLPAGAAPKSDPAKESNRGKPAGATKPMHVASAAAPP